MSAVEPSKFDYISRQVKEANRRRERNMRVAVLVELDDEETTKRILLRDQSRFLSAVKWRLEQNE